MCGVYLEYGSYGKQMGTFNPEGIKAVAGAILVSASLTSINLFNNNLGSEGAKALAPAIRDSPSLTYLWYKLRTQTQSPKP